MKKNRFGSEEAGEKEYGPPTKYDWWDKKNWILGQAQIRRNKLKQFTGYGNPNRADILLKIAAGFSDNTIEEHLVQYLDEGFLTGQAERDAKKIKEKLNEH